MTIHVAGPHASDSGSFRTWFYVTMASGSVGLAMTAPITPLYAKELGASDGIAALVVASLMVPLLVVDLVGSRVVPRVDPRAALWCGYALFGVGSLASAVAPNLLAMTLARLLQGFAAAFPIGAGFHISLGLASVGREAREIARFNTCLFVGLAIGPLIVAAIARVGDDLTGMRWAFAACAAVNLLTALLARWSLPSKPSLERPRLGLPPRAVVRGRRVRLALVTAGIAFALRGVIGMTLLPLLGDSVGAGTLGVSAAVVLMSVLELGGLAMSGRLADLNGRRPVVCWAAAFGCVLSLWATTGPAGGSYFALCAAIGFVLAGLRVAPTVMLADLAESPEAAAIGWRLASDVGTVALSAAASVAIQVGGLATSFGFAAALTALVGVLGYRNGETQPAAPIEIDAAAVVTAALPTIRSTPRSAVELGGGGR